jgi:hypothetical protein
MRSVLIALNLALCLVAASRAILAVAAPPVPAQAPTPPKSATNDAHADFEAGDYAGCLRKISALLSSKSLKPDSPERYDLLMLRGECMLRLKQRQPAAQAFQAAASGMKARGDLPRVAAATALATLVKASPDLTYRPKGQPDRAGIDVVEPASRRDAMEALFQDLKQKLAPDLDDAVQAKSLLPTNDLLPGAWELYTVEFAAQGNAASTETKLEELGGHARALIGDELSGLTTRLEQLRDLASEPTWVSQTISYRGLHTDEREELHRMADQLMKIQRTAENARRISRLLGRTGENWDTLLADCAVARDVAEQAYDRRN